MRGKCIPYILVALSFVIVAGVASSCAESPADDDVTYELHGTYTAYYSDPLITGIIGIKNAATFKGDTVTFTETQEGRTLNRTINEYFIPGGLESGQVIRITNMSTEKTYTYPFKYIPEQDCFTITLDPVVLTFCR